jgi:tRNA(Arg) A34 adenosine deaminase TadA
VIVRDGQASGEACNEVDLRHDATAHAEILAMGRPGAKFLGRLARFKLLKLKAS